MKEQEADEKVIHEQDKIIAACGNDCSACMRYVKHPFEKQITNCFIPQNYG